MYANPWLQLIKTFLIDNFSVLKSTPHNLNLDNWYYLLSWYFFRLMEKKKHTVSKNYFQPGKIKHLCYAQ